MFADNNVVLCRNPTVEICGCEIFSCTCAAKFRRDQLLSIHHAKHYEHYKATNTTRQTTSNKDHTASETHSIIRDLTSTIVASSADSMLKVLQHHSPSKKVSGTPAPSSYNYVVPKTTGAECDNQYDPRELQVAIERSLGVTALSLAKNTEVAGSVPLKNELREALGGNPTTHLVTPNQSVAQNRHWRRFRDGSTAKCPRTSRNNLLNLSDVEDDSKEMMESNLGKMESNLGDQTDAKRKKMQIMKEFLMMYKIEQDEMKKRKIRYCMKCLDDKNKETENEMIQYTFDVYTSELDAFDAQEAAINILEFAEEN